VRPESGPFRLAQGPKSIEGDRTGGFATDPWRNGDKPESRSEERRGKDRDREGWIRWLSGVARDLDEREMAPGACEMPRRSEGQSERIKGDEAALGDSFRRWGRIVVDFGVLEQAGGLGILLVHGDAHADTDLDVENEIPPVSSGVQRLNGDAETQRSRGGNMQENDISHGVISAVLEVLGERSRAGPDARRSTTFLRVKAAPSAGGRRSESRLWQTRPGDWRSLA
jgi:hypothetical protein